MSSPGGPQQSRKRVLLARGALQRVALRASRDALLQRLRPSSLLSTAAASPGAGSAVLGVAAMLVGGTRAGRLLRFAGAALAVGKLLAGLTRRREPTRT